MDLNQVTLPALDLQASVAFYLRLGFDLIVDSPDYARFECPAGVATFSLHRVERLPADSGVVVYFETEQLEQRVRELQARGVEFLTAPTRQRWLWHEARLRDPAGNQICLYHAGDNRKHPPWRVNRG